MAMKRQQGINSFLNDVYEQDDYAIRTKVVGFLNGFSIGEYDYVSMVLSAGDTTETYTFKTGGSGGTTVATVVIVYTDSTREVLSSVTKT